MDSSQVQALLRFLNQDAKVPLAIAMGKVPELIKAGLVTPGNMSRRELKALQGIFKDDKIAKQVQNASKRVSKKRAAPDAPAGLPQKKSKTVALADNTTSFATERALALPTSGATEEELSNIVLFTNRAALVLAFAVCILRYTMPEQPISSRLSLAQAVVSANSRSKAVSLGLESKQSIKKENWGEGESVMGRSAKVLKRWDYNPREGQPAEGSLPLEATTDDFFGQCPSHILGPAPPVWGIDVEAATRMHDSDTSETQKKALLIHTPQSARSYLVKSFLKLPVEHTMQTKQSRK
ncbi:hypothetical protein BJX64DRAFT_261391 [Aspergillus heterothallicus]